MKTKTSSVIIGAILIGFTQLVGANQADDTRISITGHTAGATAFISNLTLDVSNTSALKSIQFAIDPKPHSVTRPLTGTYANDYLVSRGFEQAPPATTVIVPVYGLYAGYVNMVRLTYRFMDGSSKQAVTSIATPIFNDQGCGYNNPTKFQPRTNSRRLSYDYIFVRSACGDFSPVILDSDGALRWVSPMPTRSGYFASSIFFHNGVYLNQRSQLFRVELDGGFKLLADYSNIGVLNLHHNMDPGKTGLLVEPDTTSYFECEIMEVSGSDGRVLKRFELADIISDAMIAGGDDPRQFVYSAPTDWFHNNGATYNRADDSLIISSRENFVIALDYKTSRIKWILGDKTKKRYQFPSLRKFAIRVAPGSLPPLGQHAPSITFDQHLLVLDNGRDSDFQMPKGEDRNYASPRKYSINLKTNVATEMWNYPKGESVLSLYCSSVYEDAPFNYLIDYACVNGALAAEHAQLLGLDALGEMIFYYQYPRLPVPIGCRTLYNSMPIHLESTKFPTVGPQALNFSTRGLLSVGDNVLIGGFVITGNDPKTLVLRGLGPSLSAFGVSPLLGDPVLSVYNSAGALIASNDNWQSDPNHFVVESNGLAPVNLMEAPLDETYQPGAYTVVVTGKHPAPGVALAEVYDLSPLSNSSLKNMSTRGYAGTGDKRTYQWF